MVLLVSAALADEFGAFDAEVALHGWLTPWSDAAGTGWGVHLGARSSASASRASVRR